MAWRENQTDKVFQNIVDLVEALAEQCTAINLYARNSIKTTIQQIWECSVSTPPLDKILSGSDGWVAFGAHLRSDIEEDLITLYTRIIVYIENPKTAIPLIINRLCENAHLYQSDDSDIAQTTEGIVGIYKSNPHLLVMKLLEFMDVEQLTRMGLIPVKKVVNG